MRPLLRFLALGTVVFVGWATTGCDDQGAPIAYVNGSPIQQEDYVRLLELQPSQMGASGNVGVSTLNSMVEQRLLVQEARQQGVAPTEQELNAAYTELSRDPRFQEMVKETGMGEQDAIRLFIEPSIASSRLIAKMMGITDADVQRYFQQNRPMLREPARVMARILQFDTRERAEEASKLVGKAEFETIAQNFGGGMGNVVTLTRDGMNPYPQAVVDAAFNTAKGQATGIIEAEAEPNVMQTQPQPTGKQFFLVYVEEKLPPREPDLKNPIVRDRILNALFQEKAQSLSPTALSDMMARLRKDAQISVIPPRLKEVEQGPPAAPPIPGMP